MSPNDILEQSDFACATLNRAGDPIGRLVVAMGIVSPTDKDGPGSDLPNTISDGANRALGLVALRRNKAIWEPEDMDILRPQPELRARSLRLLLAESRQLVRRVSFAVWMRARAVADNDNLSS